MPPHTCPDGTKPIATAVNGTGAPVATGTGVYYPSASSSIVPATGKAPAKLGVGAVGMVLTGLVACLPLF